VGGAHGGEKRSRLKTGEMSIREDRKQIVCEKCGRVGEVTVVLFEGNDSRMVSTTDEFSYRNQSVYCVSCRESVLSFPT
jgi:hypothetical protein